MLCSSWINWIDRILKLKFSTTVARHLYAILYYCVHKLFHSGKFQQFNWRRESNRRDIINTGLYTQYTYSYNLIQMYWIVFEWTKRRVERFEIFWQKLSTKKFYETSFDMKIKLYSTRALLYCSSEKISLKWSGDHNRISVEIE